MLSFNIGLALMAAYWPGIAGAATTPRWLVGCAIIVLLFFAARIRLTIVHGVGLALVAWLLLSLAWSAAPLDGSDAAAKILIIVGVFAYGSTLQDLRPFVAGAALGLMISGAVAVAQALGWDAIPSYHYAAGLFQNGNRMAEAAALVLAGVIAYRLWWFVPVLAPALLLPQARGAMVAAAVIVMVWAWRDRIGLFERFVAGVILCWVSLIAVALFTASGREIGVSQRLALWQDTLSGLSIFGHGLGSFAQTFPSYAHAFDVSLSRPEHPHNEVLWLAYEGGIGAVVLFVLLSAVLWMASDDQSKLVLLGLAVLCLIAMPLHDPASVLFGAVVAGSLARHRCLLRDTAVDGGSGVRARLATERTAPTVA